MFPFYLVCMCVCMYVCQLLASFSSHWASVTLCTNALSISWKWYIERNNMQVELIWLRKKLIFRRLLLLSEEFNAISLTERIYRQLQLSDNVYCHSRPVKSHGLHVSLTDFGNFSRLTAGRHNAHGYLWISRNVVIREFFLRMYSLLVGRQGTRHSVIDHQGA